MIKPFECFERDWEFAAASKVIREGSDTNAQEFKRLVAEAEPKEFWTTIDGTRIHDHENEHFGRVLAQGGIAFGLIHYKDKGAAEQKVFLEALNRVVLNQAKRLTSFVDAMVSLKIVDADGTGSFQKEIAGGIFEKEVGDKTTWYHYHVQQGNNMVYAARDNASGKITHFRYHLRDAPSRDVVDFDANEKISSAWSSTAGSKDKADYIITAKQAGY